MNKPLLMDTDKDLNRTGYAHIAFSVGSKEAVDELTAKIKDAGYVEYGRNPQGFRSRKSGWQETVLMRRELDG